MLSRDHVLALMRERVHHPAGMRELLQILRSRPGRSHRLQAPHQTLVASGELIQIRGHRFGLPEKMDLYVGRLQTHPAGYGFVVPNGHSTTAATFTFPAAMNEAMHGDRVVARIERIKDGGRAEGA
jgi:ribonuclease R